MAEKKVEIPGQELPFRQGVGMMIINKSNRGMSFMFGQLNGLQQKYKRLIMNLTIICIVVLRIAKSY